MSSFFVRPVEDYHRDIDVATAYYRDMATGLAKSTGRPFEACLDYVKRVTGPNGRLAFEDPPMKYVGRKGNGDRVLKVTTFLSYLKTVNDHRLIMAPSMTVYQNPHTEKSVTAIYIGENIKKRSKSKKAMFAAKEAGNASLASFKDNEQKTHKIKNNALSGAHCSDSTILYLDTIHSSLTSTCRSAAGYGNANNEKVLSGNRHYWSSDIVIANILAIVNHVNLTEFAQVMTEFNLVAPSIDDTMACIQYSTDFYWRDRKKMELIRRVVAGLSDLERAAFVYTGDLYHLAKHNGDVVRKMLEEIATTDNTELDDPKQYLKGMSDEQGAMVSLLCGKHMGGKNLSSFDDFTPETQRLIGATAKRLTETLEHYRLLIKVMLVSDVMPSSVANLPNIIRRNAITSDTDSTIFTVQDWLQWYSGKISFEEKAVNVGHAVAFLTSASITHILAKMSANMGVAKEQLHQYQMKSEFYFPVFALTSRAKTYFAHVGAQEGQVFTEPDLEVKGAVLKGSQSPKFVMDDADRLVNEILETVASDKKIQLYPILNRIATIEQDIADSILRGETYYYKRGEIKTADSYKLSESNSPYFHYLFWEAVFADKYGHVEAVPYGVVKVSIEADSKTDFLKWLESFEDAGIREKLVAFLRAHGKDKITTINVPQAVAEASGIPKEIINGVSTRKIVANLLEPHYVLLETLGYYTVDDNQLRLVSDTYLPPKAE